MCPNRLTESNWQGKKIKRVDIYYNGTKYSLGEVDVETIKAQIETAVTTNQPLWLWVNQGGGEPRPSELLITAATQIALIPIPEPPGDV